MAVWSILNLQETAKLRLDSEYYEPSNLELARNLAAANPVPIESFALVTDGIHGSPDWVEEEGITYLSAKCVKDNYFVLTNAGQISQAQNKANPRTQARVGDVLITTVGTIGNAAVVEEDLLPANMDRHLGIIRIAPTANVDPYYLATFLNCQFGRFQTLREATGNVQLNLFIDKINKLLVPIGDEFNQIGELTYKGYCKNRESEYFYLKAESLLLDKLSFKISDATPATTYVANLSETISSDRNDAEYFHPEKKVILNQLKQLPGGNVENYFISVLNLLNPPRTNNGEKVYNYDLTDALRFFLNEDTDLVSTHELGSTKKKFQKGDVVVSRLRSYLKEIAIVETDSEFECVGSSEFIVLRSLSSEVSPELLLVYLRSLPVQKILKWCQDGSNHPRFREKEILRLKLPDCLMESQGSIRSLVRSGISAYQDAKNMLQEAKEQLEQMILSKSKN